jgi:hypothetical protein
MPCRGAIQYFQLLIFTVWRFELPNVLGLLKSVFTVAKPASGPSPSVLDPGIFQIILDKQLGVRSIEAAPPLATWCFGISEAFQ